MSFLIFSLLATNIWVFFYNLLLFLLRLKISPPSIADFVVVWPKPEPAEIPLYLGLTILMIIGIFLVNKFKTIYRFDLNQKHSRLIKLGLLVFMLLVFLNNLGGYPLKGLIEPDIMGQFDLTDYVYLLIYLAIFVFILIESNIISKIFKTRPKLLQLIGTLFILIFITFLTFEPKFPISPHDYSFFFGPIYEVVNGKTLYTEATSQYGFLSIIFLAVLFKLELISFATLPAFIWLLYIVLYFFCFFLIYKISRSITLAFIGLFSIITLNYYSLYHLPISIPQVGAMRWLPVMLSAVLFLRYQRLDSLKFIFLTGLLSFWVVDSGLAIILAYFASLLIFFLAGRINFKTALKSGLFFIANLVLIFTIINLFHLMLGMKMIDFSNIFLRLRQYTQAGFGMLPMESQTYFWFVMLIYFASVIYFFNYKKNRLSGGTGERDPDDAQRGPFPQRASAGMKPVTESDKNRHLIELFMFVANLSFTTSAYYIGRTHPHNLFHISIFPILNLFILISLFLKHELDKLKSKRYFFTIFYLLLTTFFIVIPAFNRKEVLVKIIKTKIETLALGNIFISNFDSLLQNKFAKEIKLINENLTGPEVALLSIDDTFLLDLTGKKNLLYNNPQIAATTYQDLDFTLQKANQVCPQKIAIDCRAINKCPSFRPLNESSIFMPPLLLKALENKCGIKYKPVVCTEQLCLSVSNKIK